MFSGKMPGKSAGNGNRQQSAFKENVSKMKSPSVPSPHMSEEKAPMHPGGGEKTTIEHHPDGTHSVHHADGESTHHPSMSHAATHMAAKHDGGEHGHIHAKPEGGATTHHAGLDGMVNGPEEHGSAGEAADHMKDMMGGAEDDGNMTSMAPAGEPDDEEASWD